MKLTTAQIKDLLLTSKYVEPAKLEEAAKGAEESNRSLVDSLLFKGLVTEDLVAEVLANFYKVPLANLKDITIPREIVSLLPEDIARRYQMLPFELHGRLLKLAMTDPSDLEAKQVAIGATKKDIVPCFILPQVLERYLSLYIYNAENEFRAIVEQLNKGGVSEKETSVQDDQVIRLLDTVLAYGVSMAASDVHIELAENESLVRFRIDGILNDIARFPQRVHSAIVARIKILADLKLDEHRLPQDGRFKFDFSGSTVALRVSIIPAFYGEHVVMRILSESSRPLNFSELGLSGSNLQTLERNIDKPHGMILVTGPTGSGKTTTLYSVINYVNKSTLKICTLEDPIEYSIPRVTQSQISQTVGLTFASGLRALLRHDPNIIMVGEIRDEETVEMAIHSSLTGHLVLSTLHTNDAVGAIPRLLDMGAEPFLLASTMSAVIAQRLVRRICASCIVRTTLPEDTQEYLKTQFAIATDKAQFYHGKGCPACHGNGYKGRIGIFEVIEITPDLQKLILAKSAAHELGATAGKAGFKTMFADGVEKASAGLTTIEEVLRAIKE